MTLIVAANVQDHLILAGDHCAAFAEVSNHGPPDLVIDNFRKVYPWKYGASAASGDVLLMSCYFRRFLVHESSGDTVNLLQVAKEAKQLRRVDPAQSTGNIFFTLPGSDAFDLHCVGVHSDRVRYELIKPVTAHFSLREECACDQATCDAFSRSLRPSVFFPSIDAFQQHHIGLLKDFYRSHSAMDGMVTASFDVCLLDRRTGIGTFWHVAEPPKHLACVEILSDARQSDG